MAKREKMDFIDQYRLVAHRGLHDSAKGVPENSMAAFQLAIERGHAIELDLRITADRQVVVFHDDTLTRMCGVEGKVWEYTVEELQKLKLGKSNETIPTFAHVLEMVDGRVPLIIEYKMDRVDTKVCELGNAILEKYKALSNITSPTSEISPFLMPEVSHPSKRRLLIDVWVGQNKIVDKLSVNIRFCSSGIAKLYERRPASTWNIGI